MSSIDATTLEQRVSALEQLIPGDQLASNVFVMNSAGQVEEILEGKLTAKGIIIPEGAQTGLFTAANIEWMPAAGGATLARITEQHLGLPGFTRSLAMEILANTAGSPAAGISVSNTLKAALNSSVTASAGEQGALILDSFGNSRFLQLAVAGKHRVALGTVNPKWPVKSVESGALTIATGLTNLQGVFLQPAAGSPAVAGIVEIKEPAGQVVITQRFFTFEAPAGSESTCFWLAIGE